MAHTTEETLDSLFAQTVTDFEEMIINDVTPDSAMEVIRKHTNARLRIVEHETNSRLAGGRNTGIRESKGEYAALLNSDNKWNRTKPEKHVGLLNLHKKSA